jgi:hypothetical protein
VGGFQGRLYDLGQIVTDRGQVDGILEANGERGYGPLGTGRLIRAGTRQARSTPG